MKIYLVRSWVLEHTGKGTKEVSRTYDIIIDNLETAKNIFKSKKSDFESATLYSGFFGRVELFKPLTYEDGTLAYYPYHEIYIDTVEKD